MALTCVGSMPSFLVTTDGSILLLRTRNSTVYLCRFIASESLCSRWIRLIRVDAQIANRFLSHFWRNLFFDRECVQSGKHDVLGINFKEIPQRGTVVTAAEAVSAEGDERTRNPAGDRLGQNLHVVGRGDEDTFCVFQTLTDERYLGRLPRVQHVPALAVVGFAIEALVTGDTPNVGSNAVLFFKHLLSFQHFIHDGPTAE